MKTKPINISEEARVAAIYERDRSYPCGYHVQQLLNAETEKLRKENEELKKQLEDFNDARGLER